MKLDASQPYFGEGMPLPAVDTLTRPFWEACAAHRLMIQRCAECSAHRSPPKPVCWKCQSSNYAWSESTGRGRIFSYTIVHHSPHPTALEQIPYNIAVVELEDCEHVLLTSNVVDCPNQELRVGLPDEVTWEDRSDGQPLFRFRPVVEST